MLLFSFKSVETLLHFLYLIGTIHNAHSFLFTGLASHRLIQLQQQQLHMTIKNAPYTDIIPFLSEHIQKSDQLLFVGASTDMPIQLSKDGYGTVLTGYVLVIESDKEVLDVCIAFANSDPIVKSNIDKGLLRFKHVDYSSMSSVCTQSCVDAIVDYGALDSLIEKSNKDNVLKCIDHLQDAVRLGKTCPYDQI